MADGGYHHTYHAGSAQQVSVSSWPVMKGENSVPCVQRYVVWESDLLCCSHTS